ncbi:hypothetical protein J5U18_09880 [Sphingobacteriaceae bacterium WQ 2009]|uniref:GIY-YIG domain-containing protein n=1 Tax=Rhinopithecimicrobium faecis TaxID=2820698 RepID=A0A8T4HGW0_9SPHI|nr:hypothetical protein [Sphingobacteriaceae bacterium WQ 2009]
MTTIPEYIEAMEYALLHKADRVDVQFSKNWFNQFPDIPAVFAFFLKGELYYVGEARNLHKNMFFIYHWKMKTERIRRERGYIPDVKVDYLKRLFTKEDLRLFKISFIKVELGRKECQEFLVAKYKPKYNLLSQ